MSEPQRLFIPISLLIYLCVIISLYSAQQVSPILHYHIVIMTNVIIFMQVGKKHNKNSFRLNVTVYETSVYTYSVCWAT